MLGFGYILTNLIMVLPDTWALITQTVFTYLYTCSGILVNIHAWRKNVTRK